MSNKLINLFKLFYNLILKTSTFIKLVLANCRICKKVPCRLQKNL